MIKYGLLLWLLCPLSVDAGFRFAMPMILDEASSGYRFNVPDAVYQRVHHADLRDVRITNQAGDEVPMRISLNEDLTRTSWSRVSLPLFSLRRLQEVPVTSQQTRTSWQGDEESFTVTTSEQVRRYVEQQVADDERTVLIDASVVSGQNLKHLELQWSFQTEGNRVFYVDLKGSHDLANWRTVRDRQKLIELDTGGRVVLENRLPLGQADYAYYKLVFTGPEVPTVQAVTAWISREHRNSPLQWQSVKVLNELDRETVGHGIQWDTGGYYPVEAVRLVFDYPNLMAGVRLYSRPGPEASWRLVSSADVYDVGQGELSMFNDRLSFPTNQHRHWRLLSDSAINSQWIKHVEFAWRSHQVHFLAQGEAPFTLQFGDREVNSWPSVKWYQTLNQEMRNNLFSSAVWLGELNVHSVTAVPEPEPEPVVNQSRLVFWGLLVLVLTVLLVMAVRLLREVGDDQ